MRVVIQRVKEASVKVENNITGRIQAGLLILLGIEEQDTAEDVDWLVRKITQLRIFEDEEGKMNRSLIDISGEALVVSQFTLHASTKKGNRPSFIKAAKPDISLPLYNDFILKIKSVLSESKVQTGSFGAMMEVDLVNYGPVTIIIDTKNKE